MGEARNGLPALLRRGGYLHTGFALFYLSARFTWISVRVREAAYACRCAFVNECASVLACVRAKDALFSISLESGTW